MTQLPDAKIRTAIDALLDLGDPSKVSSKDDFGAFERRLRERTMAVEREILAAHLKAADIDEPEVEIDGVLHRKVMRSSQTYLTAAGEVAVERTLYRPRGSRDEATVPALDRIIGMVEGHLTPHAAATAMYLVSELTPKGAEALLERIGTMTVSKSTLHRLPNAIRETWEADRTAFENALRSTIVITPNAFSVAVSLDGVMAPMVDGRRAEKRAATEAAGLSPSGPAGYREVGCATVSFCDGKGDLISAIRMARSPEKNKLTLKEMVQAELSAVLTIRPNLRVVKLADGAEDNWTFLSEEIRSGVEVIDFFHAVEHLSHALNVAYGEGSIEARRRLVELRHSLVEEDEGAERVIRALGYLAKKHSKRPEIARALGYFKKHRARMSYSALKKQIDDVLAPRGSPDFLQASQTALATTSRLAPRPVPVFDIVAAAGFARDGQLAAVQGWALVDQPVDERHFVVRVEGDSISPQVAPGSWCLFRRCRELPSRGAVVLVEKNQEEGGGGYLLKRLERVERTADGAVMVMLSSSNPDHPPLALPARSESDVRIVAELVCIVAPG